jgi:hypothetical protein
MTIPEAKIPKQHLILKRMRDKETEAPIPPQQANVEIPAVKRKKIQANSQ